MGNSFDRVHLFVLVDHFSLKLLKQAQVRPLQPLLLLQCFLILKLLELSSYVLFDKSGIAFGFATSDHFISLYDLLDHLLVILQFFLIAIFGEKFRRDSHHCRFCEFHLLWNGLVYDAFRLLEGQISIGILGLATRFDLLADVEVAVRDYGLSRLIFFS